ncbi:MAG: potassium channel protein [Deltaproteobacteria bacterium]|nr:potassium channel protein [Deltaproteobacteria bacterium]
MIPLLFPRFLRRWLRNPPSHLRVVALLVAVLCYGASGFLYFELAAKPELGWTDAFWWALVTITTIGYGDFFPTSAGGRFLVAVPIMLFGIGLLGYVLSLAASALVEAKTRAHRGLGGMKLNNHLIVINFPNLSKVLRVIDELRHANALGHDIDVILVDEDLEELPPELEQRHVHYVRGNPTRDDTLSRASVDEAAHAVILSKNPGDPHTDDRNVAIVLAIEGREHKARTVVECIDESTLELLHKAGCDRVVCTSRFDAHFLGSEVVNVGAQDVVEELLSNLTGEQLFLTPYDKASRFSEVAARCRELEHIPIGVRRDKKTLLRVADDFEVHAGDSIITIGARRIRL